MKRKIIKKIILCSVVLISSALLIICLYLYMHQSPEGEERQDIEESLAEQYIIDMKDNKQSSNKTEGETEAIDIEAPSDENSETAESTDSTASTEFSDDIYYNRGGVTYTPDYAVGYLDCVLEIPCIQLRRGVYASDTWAGIQHDLDIWMTVTCRPDYVLGETTYCIYGHNHTEQNLSFNRLKDVKVGDYFTLTQNETVYYYVVTNFFADWREIITRDYVNNTANLSKDNCYIFTCGRNEYRYKDIVVVGTLAGTYDISDWEENSDYYINNKTPTIDLPDINLSGDTQTDETADVSIDQIETKLDIQQDNSCITITLLDSDGNKVNGETIAAFDSDGLVIEQNEEELRWIQNDDSYTIDLADLSLEDNEIIIGVVENMPEGYKSPSDVVLTVSKDSSVVKQENVEDVKITDEKQDLIMKIAFGILFLFNVITIIIIVFKK